MARKKAQRKGLLICEVCNAAVTPKRERTVQEYYAGKPAGHVDVMDCPICGCQIELSARRMG